MSCIQNVDTLKSYIELTLNTYIHCIYEVQILYLNLGIILKLLHYVYTNIPTSEKCLKSSWYKALLIGDSLSVYEHSIVDNETQWEAVIYLPAVYLGVAKFKKKTLACEILTKWAGHRVYIRIYIIYYYKEAIHVYYVQIFMYVYAKGCIQELPSRN